MAFDSGNCCTEKICFDLFISQYSSYYLYIDMYINNYILFVDKVYF